MCSADPRMRRPARNTPEALPEDETVEADSAANPPEDADAPADSELSEPAAETEAALPEDEAPGTSAHLAVTPGNDAAEGEETPQDDELNQ